MQEYDDYDPNDIPEDQAKPEEVTEGYNYPVPENPLVLPTKPTLPDCVPVGEEELGEEVKAKAQIVRKERKGRVSMEREF